MNIEIHTIQNHGPSNLNRDKMGEPKTCLLGEVQRNRISSQCIKRSIRMSEYFQELCCSIRTRHLVEMVIKEIESIGEKTNQVIPTFEAAGLIKKPKKANGKSPKVETEDDTEIEDSTMKWFTKLSVPAIAKIFVEGKTIDGLVSEITEIIATRITPVMALMGRMMKTGNEKVWNGFNPDINAALQVAHSISTHQSLSEVDYFTVVDDAVGISGAGHINEAMFSSACLYGYSSINWGILVNNLLKQEGEQAKELAAHVVGAWLYGIGMVDPTGKQTGMSEHSRPEGILVEIRDSGNMSYGNSFVEPIVRKSNLVGDSISALGQRVSEDDIGYGSPIKRFWFSPGCRYDLLDVSGNAIVPTISSLDDLVSQVVTSLGFDWESVKRTVSVEA